MCDFHFASFCKFCDNKLLDIGIYINTFKHFILLQRVIRTALFDDLIGLIAFEVRLF